MALPTEQGFQPPRITDPYEKLPLLQEAEGFYATSIEEVHEGFELLLYRDRTGGAARHLNEILLHQQGANTDDPTRAVRRITRGYADFYQGATTTTTNLAVLERDLAEADNPKLSLEMVFGANHAGLGGLIRYIDLRKLVAFGVEGVEFDPLKTDYTKAPSPETTEYIMGKAVDLTVGDIRGVTNEAVMDQNNRRMFWRGMLTESRSHSAARPIVNEVL